jgi:hypothetical protein
MIEQQDLEIYDLMLANEQGEEESDSGTLDTTRPDKIQLESDNRTSSVIELLF